MARETSVYPDPEKFDLNRWLDDAGQLNNNVNFPNFGFGRRCVLSPICGPRFARSPGCSAHSISYSVCPGQSVAERYITPFHDIVLLFIDVLPRQVALHCHCVHSVGVEDITGFRAPN